MAGWLRLGPHLYGNQLGGAARILDGSDGVLGCESSHNKGQLAVGRGLDRRYVNPLHVLGDQNTDSVHFHNKLCIFHGFLLLLFYAERLDNELISSTRGLKITADDTTSASGG
jgi:hypothetical protein